MSIPVEEIPQGAGPRWEGEGGGTFRALPPRFLALAAFLFAGDLKGDPRLAGLPVDLTLLTGGILSGVLLRRLLKGARIRAPRTLGILALWYATFIPGLAGLAGTAYALQKAATLFTFTLLASLAPLVLIQRAEDLRPLVRALGGACLLITLGGLLAGGAGSGSERLQGFGGGTISLGRASGLLFMIAFLDLAEGAPRPLLSGLRMALGGIAALFAGARGPILAALLALGALVPGGGWMSGRRLLGPLAGLALMVPVLAASLALAPGGSLRRLEAFARGEYGGSERYRVEALRESWDRIQRTPAGVGWGGFATWVDPEKGLGRQYPHNLIAETALEGGWICGAFTLGVLGLSGAAAWVRRGHPAGRLAFSGLLFYGVNALVSGDINDSRPLFLFISASLALGEVRP